MGTIDLNLRMCYQPPTTLRFPDPAYWTVNGRLSQGLVVTPVPFAVAQDFAPAPFGQFHQFSVASTLPLPRLSIPIPLVKSLKWASSCPPGALNATEITSFSKTFSSTIVPKIGA